MSDALQRRQRITEIRKRVRRAENFVKISHCRFRNVRPGRQTHELTDTKSAILRSPRGDEVISVIPLSNSDAFLTMKCFHLRKLTDVYIRLCQSSSGFPVPEITKIG